MHQLLSAVLVFVMFACSAISKGEPSSIDGKRMVYLQLAIRRAALQPVRDAFAQMAIESSDPITVVISSPGGEVISGMSFVGDMRLAKSRGITLNCYVLDMAASMAFQMLTECTNRYALKSSYLLWHGVRVGGIESAVTAETAQALADDLGRMDVEVLDQLDHSLHIGSDAVRFHFHRETLWSGRALEKEDPRFISSYAAFPQLMKELPKAVSMKQPNLLDMLFGGEVTYQYIWDKYSYMLRNPTNKANKE